VGDILARDPDEGVNAIVQYSIIGGQDAEAFTLVPRPESGLAELLTRIELDYESPRKRYEILVRAASPPLRTDVIVEINVVDVNDNVPVLNDFRLVLNNFRNYFPLGPVARVPVFDADVNDQVRFCYLNHEKLTLGSSKSQKGFQLFQPLSSTFSLCQKRKSFSFFLWTFLVASSQPLITN
jgi:cadherin EGF LAG seven-pass G-type receptor 1